MPYRRCLGVAGGYADVFGCGRLHMFYNERVMDIPDGLPKWTGLNEGEDSHLIEDSPPDMVRDLERKRVEEQKKRSSFETEFGDKK